MNTILFVLLGVSIISLIFQVLSWTKPKIQHTDFTPKVYQFSASLARIEGGIKDHFKWLRNETIKIDKGNRAELYTVLSDFKQEVNQTLKAIAEQNQMILSKLSEGIEPPLFHSNENIETSVNEKAEQVGNGIPETLECNTSSLEKLNDKIELKINDLSVIFMLK
jgi:hypothetical protein